MPLFLTVEIMWENFVCIFSLSDRVIVCYILSIEVVNMYLMMFFLLLR